jgi:hypothetical protein
MACITHLGIENISYCRKKGQKSKCQFDSWLLKVENCFDLITCRRLAKYCWKTLDESYNFALNLASIKSLHTKLWASKVVGLLILGISRFQLGSPRTKWHFSASPMAKHRKYYKEEAPKFGPWWVLWVHVYPWLACAPKVFWLCINQLVVWFVRFMWIIEPLITLPNLIPEL